MLQAFIEREHEFRFVGVESHTLDGKPTPNLAVSHSTKRYDIGLGSKIVFLCHRSSERHPQQYSCTRNQGRKLVSMSHHMSCLAGFIYETLNYLCLMWSMQFVIKHQDDAKSRSVDVLGRAKEAMRLRLKLAHLALFYAFGADTVRQLEGWPISTGKVSPWGICAAVHKVWYWQGVEVSVVIPNSLWHGA